MERAGSAAVGPETSQVLTRILVVEDERVVALCEVAGMLRSRLRADDVPARYGGDETVVLLPDTTLDGARVVAEKLRLGVRDLRVTYGGRTLPPVSISAGVGAYPASGTDAVALMKAVDVALYRAKGDGRDRVAVANA